MKKKFLFVPLIGMLLAGCSTSDLMFWQKKEEKIQEKDGSNPDNGPGDGSSEGGGGEISPPEGDFETKTINFYGSYLYSGWSAPGVNFDSTLDSAKTQTQNLVDSVNDQVNNQNLLSELFITKSTLGYYESGGLVLQIGTGNPAKDNFQKGTFTWTSTKKIFKIVITGQCYVKDQGATDSNASMTIEAGAKGSDTYNTRPIADSTTDTMSFAVESDKTPQYVTYTQQYSEGIERFCLTSNYGRMFLKSLSITWGTLK